MGQRQPTSSLRLRRAHLPPQVVVLVRSRSHSIELTTGAALVGWI